MDPLCRAAKFGHLDEVRTLLASGTSPNCTGELGKTSLHEAASKGHTAIVKELLVYGADPCVKGFAGWTALYAAALGGHKACVEALLEAGADPCAQSSAGMTALHVAVLCWRHDCVNAILKHNKKCVLIRDCRGCTARDLAKHKGNTVVMQQLRLIEMEAMAGTSGDATEGDTPSFMSLTVPRKHSMSPALTRQNSTTDRRNQKRREGVVCDFLVPETPEQLSKSMDCLNKDLAVSLISSRLSSLQLDSKPPTDKAIPIATVTPRQAAKSTQLNRQEKRTLKKVTSSESAEKSSESQGDKDESSQSPIGVIRSGHVAAMSRRFSNVEPRAARKERKLDQNAPLDQNPIRKQDGESHFRRANTVKVQATSSQAADRPQNDGQSHFRRANTIKVQAMSSQATDRPQNVQRKTYFRSKSEPLQEEGSADGYIKNRLLHTDQFFKVFEGFSSNEKKKVVIKIVKDQLSLALSQRVEASTELGVLRSLPRHENIVRLLEFKALQKSIWLIREACSGVSLSMYVMVNEPNLKRKSDVMLQLASGVVFMHSLSTPVLLCHINTSNVIIHEAEPNGIVAKWTDFGTCQALYNIMSKNMCSPTVYDAPESWSDEDTKTVSIATDTFAVGALLAAIIIWPNFAKDRRMEPFIESEPNNEKAIGDVMRHYSRKRGKIPSVFSLRNSGDVIVNSLKKTVNDMTNYHHGSRPPMRDVARSLGTIQAELQQRKSPSQY